MRKEINGLEIEIVSGNIVKQEDITAVVNAANAQLRRGGGVAGAIHSAAGPRLEEETLSLAPITPGEAVITDAHNLPNQYIIHVLGPVYGRDKPEAEILADCYQNALKIAEENNIKFIAFPAISTGAFGYPVQKAAKVALSTVHKMTEGLHNIELIRFVLFSEKDYEIHKLVLNNILA